MNDLNHYIGADLTKSPTGGISTVSGIERGKQRVLRRLLTNPGDYVFHPEYGAGLGAYVGQIINVPQLTGLIRGQMLLEDVVAKTPPPSVQVTPRDDGTLFVNLSYIDAPSGEPTTLAFDVGAA
ncbi:phage tail protein [Chromobacterium amazonense]|uniref:Phage tail protein n=1 Tax=Chromobacterium amazonense TaxID=1382803 RepID=A0A2S9WZ02_9NEIS|nr:phage tail protein [Chromobacterium amazonense]PRP68691.1 phage tail protein [Chromobacterium amazonense]